MLHRAAVLLARYLGRELDLDCDQQEVIRYGLELVLGDGVKVALLLLVALPLGLVGEVGGALVGWMALRVVSGGPHFTTFGRCLMGTLLLFLPAGATAVILAASLSVTGLTAVALGAWVLAAVWVYRWAPVEVPERPIGRKVEYSHFKMLSRGVVLALPAGVLLLMVSGLQGVSKGMLLAVILGCLGQAGSLTPAGRRAAGWLDTALSVLGL